MKIKYIFFVKTMFEKKEASVKETLGKMSNNERNVWEKSTQDTNAMSSPAYERLSTSS